MKRLMRPLDFVVSEAGSVGMVTQVDWHEGKPLEEVDVSVYWFVIGKVGREKSAWWLTRQLKVVDNLPNLLAVKVRHAASGISGCYMPFGVEKEE